MAEVPQHVRKFLFRSCEGRNSGSSECLEVLIPEVRTRGRGGRDERVSQGDIELFYLGGERGRVLIGGVWDYWLRCLYRFTSFFGLFGHIFPSLCNRRTQVPSYCWIFYRLIPFLYIQ